LVDGDHFVGLKFVDQFIERQRNRFSDMSVNLKPERGRVDGGGNVRQVPAYVEAIIGREHAMIKDLERRLEQRGAGTLQEHGALLREAGDQLTPTIDEGKLAAMAFHGDAPSSPAKPTPPTRASRSRRDSCVDRKLDFLMKHPSLSNASAARAP
jgi:hypothetical protein